MKQIKQVSYQPSPYFTIDSFKIRIPFNKVEIVSPNLNVDHDTINTFTGEIIETKCKTKEFFKDKDNILNTEYTIENQITKHGNIETYLTIKIVSKHLRENYFDGINNGNIKKVYNSLISEKIIDFTYTDFLKGSLTDIDYCLNFFFTDKEYVQLVERFKNQSRSSIKAGEGIFTFNKKINQGFQFGKREYATPSKPYFKVYNKTKHISTDKMNRFFDKYLSRFSDSILTKVSLNKDDNKHTVRIDKNLYRYEFTLKNRKMFKYYGLTKFSLNDFLNISNDKIIEISNGILLKHLNQSINIDHLKDTNKMNNLDFHAHLLLTICIDNNIGIDHLKETVKQYHNRTTALNNAKRIDRIYLENYRTFEKVKMNENIDNFAKFIGIP